MHVCGTYTSPLSALKCVASRQRPTGTPRCEHNSNNLQSLRRRRGIPGDVRTCRHNTADFMALADHCFLFQGILSPAFPIPVHLWSRTTSPCSIRSQGQADASVADVSVPSSSQPGVPQLFRPIGVDYGSARVGVAVHDGGKNIPLLVSDRLQACEQTLVQQIDIADLSTQRVCIARVPEGDALATAMQHAAEGQHDLAGVPTNAVLRCYRPVLAAC